MFLCSLRLIFDTIYYRCNNHWDTQWKRDCVWMDRGNAFGRIATGTVCKSCATVCTSHNNQKKEQNACAILKMWSALCNCISFPFALFIPFFLSFDFCEFWILSTLSLHSSDWLNSTAVSLKQISILMMLPNICSTPFINIT